MEKQKHNQKVGIILVCVAFFLLLQQFHVLSGDVLPELEIAVLFVYFGVKLIQPKQAEYKETVSYRNDEMNEDNKKAQNDYSSYETCPPVISVVLSQRHVSCLKGSFLGTRIQTVLGTTKLDLCQADIDREVYVQVNVVLGTTEIQVPVGANVICDVKAVLGDVKDYRMNPGNQGMNQPPIRIVGDCTLGSIILR